MGKIVKLWKDLGITHVDFNFSCGGDSMNDTEIHIHTKDGEIKNSEISDFIDNQVYMNVEFYVNSDGHYQGEFGNVEITLVESDEYDDDEDEAYFEYTKSSRSEWNESFTSECFIKLTDDEFNFIKNNVVSINGDSDQALIFAYNKDLFLNNKNSEMFDKLNTKIENELADYEPELSDEFKDGEFDDYYSYECIIDNETLKENGVLISVSHSVRIIKDDDN